MQRAVEAYVAGVRERNVGAMQRVFPGMPADMRQNWAALFSAVRSVDAQAAALEIELPEGESDAGSGQLTLRVRFPNPASRRECVQETRLRLRLARTAGAWRIVELTQLGSTGSPGCG
jgi:hypothetical protein